MKKIGFLLALLFLCEAAYSEIVVEQLKDPSYLNKSGSFYAAPQNYIEDSSAENSKENTTSVTTQTLYGSSISSATLSKIERKVFGRNFVGDNNLNRLTRLEQRVFGAVQRGETQNRVARLKTATQNYANNYAYAQNVYPPNYYYNRRPNYGYGYYNNPYNNPYNMYAPYRPYKITKLKGIFRALTGGSLTGFTPPVNDLGEEELAKVSQNGYTNSTMDPYSVYNGYGASNTGYTWSNSYQNPYSGSTYSTYAGPNQYGQSGNYAQNGYYTPANAPTNRMDIFSNGASGSETYYDDGRYRRHMSSTGGGCGVKIIY